MHLDFKEEKSLVFLNWVFENCNTRIMSSLSITAYSSLHIDPFPVDINIVACSPLCALTSLTLQRWFISPSLVVPTILPNLTHLCVISDKTSEAQPIASQFTRLKSLTLRFYTDKAFETLSTTLTRLEYLNIGNLSEVKENDTIEYTSSNGRELTDTSAHHVSRLTNLVSLNLCGLKLTDQSLAHLTTLTRLRLLDLTYCLKITDDGLNKLTTLTNLEHLELWKTKITEGSLQQFVTRRNTTWNKRRLLKVYDS